ncbi:MAG: energy-dependent translational throttle protein EttA, partial [Planctomycetes bacterium]|nr:energy-dependent translational throttle protein EttA [Planctomycetota bacterium]
MHVANGQPILTLNNIVKNFGTRVILSELNLTINSGDRIGVLGVNGCGKSTLMRIIAGIDGQFEGERILRNNINMGYVAQEPPLDEDKTVKENVMIGAKAILDLLERFDELNVLLGEVEGDELEKVMKELEEIQLEIDFKDGWEIDRHIEVAMDSLCLPPDDSQVNHLSGGERRRVALCRFLMSHPDLLVLDEPTNHLDAETISWLEGFIQSYQGTVLLVTHDRYFLDNVANRMVEVTSGKIASYEGNYSDYLEKKAAIEELQKKSELSRQKLYAKELEWVHKTPKGRNTKNRARLKNFKALQEAPPLDVLKTASFCIPEGPRLGDRVLELKNLHKGFGERELIQGLDLIIEPGAIIGVVGPNGVGKSTLVKMILGREQPDKGEIRIGQNTVFAYIDQQRNVLDEKQTVFENISEGSQFIQYGKQELAIRHYLARFLFTGPIQQTPVTDLSGGERNRVTLAKMLKTPGNFLILDEPTNDLDLMTLRVLEEALESYRGCALVVTHDRYFLDRIATGILAFEGDGSVYYCDG